MQLIRPDGLAGPLFWRPAGGSAVLPVIPPVPQPDPGNVRMVRGVGTPDPMRAKTSYSLTGGVPDPTRAKSSIGPGVPDPNRAKQRRSTP
jgi:hypothetical protein